MSKLEDAFLGLECAFSNHDFQAYKETNSETVKAIAEANDLEIIYAQEDQLFVDLDSEQAYDLFKRQIDLVENMVVSYKTSESKSGLPHRHVIVNLSEKLDIMERIALQSALGSDRRCELLRYIRVKENDPHPILFLEKKCG